MDRINWPYFLSTLSAFGFAWNPTLDLAATAGNNTVPLTNSSSLLNTTFAANALTPLISGTYLINYIIDLAGGDTAPSGTFSIFVNGAVVPGSQYDIGVSESGAAVGQALASVVAGQPVIVNFNAGLAGTLLATSVSLTLEKVG